MRALRSWRAGIGCVGACASEARAADRRGGAYYEFMMGLQLESQGDSAGAAAAYQRAERLDPQSAEIPAALAELYARMNRPADALAAGERAVKANPDESRGQLDSRAASTRAWRRCRTRATPTAGPTRSARSPISRRPTATRIPAVPMMLGRLYIADDAVRQGRCHARAVRDDQPDQVEAVALLAEAYQATDRDADAIALLEKSVEDAPELYGALGQVYQDSGRWQRCGAAFQGAVEERPQSLPLRAQWATALLNPGDAQRAREVLEAGIGGQLTQAHARCICSRRRSAARAIIAAAEVTARRLIALDTRALGGPRQLAQILRDQNEHQKIVALLEPIVTARFKAADAADLTSETFRGMYFDLATGLRERCGSSTRPIAMLRQARDVVADRSARGRSGSRGRRRTAAKATTPFGRCRRPSTKFPKEPAREAVAGVHARARAEVQRSRGGVPSDDRGRSEKRRRAQLARLHARRTRTEPRRSGVARGARARRSSPATARISTAWAGRTTSRIGSTSRSRR